ncbi:MAG: hypothetical protein ACOY3E_10145 [Pseudomonadota bacterium]
MRTFWSIAFINLFVATLYTVSALWVTFNPASGCTVNGVPCNAYGVGSLLLYIGGPTLVLVLSVVIGARLRRDRPKTALVLVTATLLLLIAWVFAYRSS